MENCKGTIVNNNYCCCCCKGNTGAGEETVKVGTIIYAHILQSGYVKANGDLLNRATYSNLYKYAKENNLILSEVDWANNMQGMFAEGDGANTFRVPDLRGQFLRGLDDGAGEDSDRVLGSKQEDAIRNITGSIKGIAHFGVGGATGALHVATTNIPDTDMDISQNGNSVVEHIFDASRVVPTAEENRPKNVALITQIKY